MKGQRNMDAKSNRDKKSNAKSLFQEYLSNQNQGEKLLLCADPDSYHLYLLNQETNNIFIVQKAPQSYRQKAFKTIQEMKSIINLNEGNWLCISEEGEKYRRRKIPKYLLQNTQTDYPVYICQSPLSSAFKDQQEIVLKVDISSYKEEIFQEEKEDSSLFLSIKVGLVQSADQVLKNILRQIYKEYGVKLHPIDENKDFILKVTGFREYLMGPYPMLSYERVRICLRGQLQNGIPIKLMEAELYKNTQKYSFPPHVMRSEDDIVMNSPIVITESDWKRFESIPILMWYPPKKLKKINFQDIQTFTHYFDNTPIEKLEFDNIKQYREPKNPDGTLIGQKIIKKKQINQNSSQNRQNSFGKKKKQRQYLWDIDLQRKKQEYKEQGKEFIQNQHKDNDKELIFRVILKQRIEKEVQQRRNLYQKNIYPVEDFTLLTGENETPFKIKIKGIDNFFRIFEQADENLADNDRATYTGVLPMRYIQKNFEYKQAKERGEKIERQELKEGTFEKLLKLYDKKKVTSFNKVQMPSDRDIPSLLNPLFHNHGKQETLQFTQLAKKFDLDFTPYLISIRVKILVGEVVVSKIEETKKIPFNTRPVFNQWITWNNLKYSQLSLETKLAFDVIVYNSAGTASQVIGTSKMAIFSDECQFFQGLKMLNIWPFYISNNRLICQNEYYGLCNKQERPPDELIYDRQKREKFLSKNYGRIAVELEAFQSPMYWSLKCQKTSQLLYLNQSGKREIDFLSLHSDPNDIAKLKDLLEKDPLNRNWTTQERIILFTCREFYKTLPEGLDFFISSLKPNEPLHYREAYQKIEEWAPPQIEHCLTFLDAQHGDDIIRYYAVNKLSQLSNDEIKIFILEFIQALIFENNHYSPLCELLLERALLSPCIVGREFFWGLRSQLHIKPTFERFGIVLEQLIMLSGNYRSNLLKQVELNDKIMNIAKQVKLFKPTQDMTIHQYAQKLLEKMQQSYFQNGLTFALDNRLQCSEFIYKKIKVMSSKKKPLWLVMKNEEQENQQIMLMFKDGDDIRQDQLVLQLISIMDKIWLDNGLDFRMNIYKVLPTKDQVGMIEVVTNSETTASIHKKKGVFAAWEDSGFHEFLKEFNPTEQDYQNCITNFVHSCAGYCIATYILGIGDRHSDNIMLQKTGNLFHIDFGHFLGHFKVKYGIKRERTPFVFTEEMCYVMGGTGGELYKSFEEMCCKGYNLIRKHGHFIINIFKLMLSAGIPELQNAENIEYLNMILSLELSEQQAAAKFRKELKNTLKDTFKSLDNMIHEIVTK